MSLPMRLLLLVICTAVLPNSAPAKTLKCLNLFGSKTSQVHTEYSIESKNKTGVILVNSQPVTSARHYPFEIVLYDLDLSLQQLHGRKVLSVGEGMSEFVPILNRNGVEALGLDFWYNGDLSANKELEKYVNENRRHLLAASAESIPLADNTVDVVTMHQSVFYFDNLEKAIGEALRVLKPRGKLHIYAGCLNGECFNSHSVVHSAKFHKGRVTYSTERNTTLTFRGRKIEMQGHLSIVE